jgi:hypothetical protein
VTLILDTAPLVSLADTSEPRRDAVLAALRDEDGPLILPAPATAEIDYLLGSRFGQGAREAFLTDLASGRFTVACLELGDYTIAVDLDRRYAGQLRGDPRRPSPNAPDPDLRRTPLPRRRPT